MPLYDDERIVPFEVYLASLSNVIPYYDADGSSKF